MIALLVGSAHAVSPPARAAVGALAGEGIGLAATAGMVAPLVGTDALAYGMIGGLGVSFALGAGGAVIAAPYEPRIRVAVATVAGGVGAFALCAAGLSSTSSPAALTSVAVGLAIEPVAGALASIHFRRRR